MENNEKSLMERYKEANEKYVTAVNDLTNYTSSPNIDTKVAATLSERMTDASSEVSKIKRMIDEQNAKA